MKSSEKLYCCRTYLYATLVYRVNSLFLAKKFSLWILSPLSVLLYYYASFYIVTIRPDNFLLSGLSGIRPDSEIHYPVHPY